MIVDDGSGGEQECGKKMNLSRQALIEGTHCLNGGGDKKKR